MQIKEYLRKSGKYIQNLNIKNKLERARKYTLEYFLGTETRKFYRREKELSEEFFEDKDNLKEMMKGVRRLELGDIIVGKYIPNLIDIGVITYSLATKNPKGLYGIIISEMLRNFVNYGTSINKRFLESMNYKIARRDTSNL